MGISALSRCALTAAAPSVELLNIILNKRSKGTLQDKQAWHHLSFKGSLMYPCSEHRNARMVGTHFFRRDFDPIRKYGNSLSNLVLTPTDSFNV